MNKLNAKAILPVIHVNSLDQATRNIIKCIECGADGCFLINHLIEREELIDVGKECRLIFPEYWLGINDLSVRCVEDLGDLLFLDGLWTDKFFNLYDYYSYDGMYFGGVAFKYQPVEKDLKLACENVLNKLDVITTSGSATGKSPSIEKIKEIRSYIDKSLLAIASGLSSENILEYLEYIDIMMLSTSISNEDEIDSLLLKDFIKKFKDANNSRQ